MAYLIAIGSSDGKVSDLKFGEVQNFFVYKIEGTDYELSEVRNVSLPEGTGCDTSKCGTEGAGCSSASGGCGGSGEAETKVELIKDCRAIICKKIGFQAQKQLARYQISVFDVELPAGDALEKISAYYAKLDGKKQIRPED